MHDATYKEWQPIDDLPGTLYLEGLHDDYEGFRLLLRGRDPLGRVLRITFDPALSYRNTDEGDLLASGANFAGPLNIVENSSYLAWFHKESRGIYERKGEKVTHYLVVTCNDCVDVLAASAPKIEWL